MQLVQRVALLQVLHNYGQSSNTSIIYDGETIYVVR